MRQKHRQLLSEYLPEAIIRELKLVSQEKDEDGLRLTFGPKQNVMIVDHGIIIDTIEYHDCADDGPHVMLSSDDYHMAFSHLIPKEYLRLFREKKY